MMLDQLRTHWKAAAAVIAALTVVILTLVFWPQSDPEPGAGGAVDIPPETSANPPTGAPSPSGTLSPDQDETPEPTSRNPLSGEPLESPSTMQVIAVRVGNADAERPQVGLSEAELIYETLLEGGETRFIALYFEGHPVEVGPVRSIRPVDAAILAPFEPLFAFSGGQDFVYRSLTAAMIDVLDESDTQALVRGNGTPPHNLFLDFDSARSRATGGPPSEMALPFTSEWESTGESGSVIEFALGSKTIGYSYEPGIGYLRTQDGGSFDVLTSDGSEPLSRDTVLIQFVGLRSAGYADVAGAEVPDFDVVGFGEALIFHAGTMQQVEWRRSSQRSGTLFFDANGDSISLPSGQMIIELVPVGTLVTGE